MKKWLLLDVNGPLGDVVSEWFKAMNTAIEKGLIRSADRKTLEDIRKILGEGKYENSPEEYGKIIGKIEDTMKDESVIKHLKEHFKNYYNRYQIDLRERFKGFDRIILYSTIPHRAVKIIGEVLSDLTGRSIDTIGSTRFTETGHRDYKERYSILIPQERDAIIYHVTDDDPRITGIPNYFYIKDVRGVDHLLEKLREI